MEQGEEGGGEGYNSRGWDSVRERGRERQKRIIRFSRRVLRENSFFFNFRFLIKEVHDSERGKGETRTAECRIKVAERIGKGREREKERHIAR